MATFRHSFDDDYVKEVSALWFERGFFRHTRNVTKGDKGKQLTKHGPIGKRITGSTVCHDNTKHDGTQTPFLDLEFAYQSAVRV